MMISLCVFFLGLDEFLDFANHFVSGVFNRSHETLRRSLNIDGLELLLLDFRGRFQVRLAKGAAFIAAFGLGASLLLRRMRLSGRQAGCDVFGAVDFFIVPPLLKNGFGLFFAGGFSASLLGAAVRLLVQATRGTKAHAATAASGKISLTHNV